MMSFTAVLLAAALQAAAPQEKPFQPGPRVVQMRRCCYYTAPKPAGVPLEKKPLYGDSVTAVGVEGRWIRVTLADATTAYIFAGALVEPEKFDPQPENEEEQMRLKAQNYKSGRFDKETEEAYTNDKGPEMKAAYAQVDALMATPDSKTDRIKLEKVLAAFRKEGHLGEFADSK